MSISSRIEFSYMDLEKEIEGFHSDYYYLLDEVDTDLYKEMDKNGLVFVADYLDELQLIEKDMHKLILHIEAKIEEIEIELEQRLEAI